MNRIIDLADARSIYETEKRLLGLGNAATVAQMPYCSHLLCELMQVHPNTVI